MHWFLLWPVLGLGAIAAIALDFYAVYRALTRGHAVESTFAWIFAVFAFPAVGAAAYFLLADPGVRRAMRRKKLSKRAIREAVRRLSKNAPSGIHAGLSPAERSILHLSAAVTEIPPTAGNRVQLLTRSESAFSCIESALLAARRSIWAECYLIRNDETGYLFLDLLARKAREGVEVRLLYDAFGSLGIDRRRLRALQAAGGKVDEFLPMNPLRQRWAIHLRNHRKVILIDEETGFTGGMNMGDEYSGRARRRGGQFFRDTHLLVRGPAVSDLALIFAEDWSYATGEELQIRAHTGAAAEAPSIVAIVPSGPDQEHNTSGLLYFTGIVSASKRCFLTSPYFIPDGPTIRALMSAALRGVDVRLLVPGKNDVALIGPAARSYYSQLVRSGVRIFEYQPSMLHAKTMVVDGAWGLVGSANVDIRSFRLNFEVGALVADRRFAGELEDRFHADLKESIEITSESLDRLGVWTRLKEGMARLLSPIL
ncbi:MAG: cardiolipin synthase [Planctomycetes bacterium]|nr:cardiolipin synthase [Planctomycetota bacterium]